jgi:hypothetical protein
VKEYEMDRACSTNGRECERIEVSGGKPEGKKTLGRLGSRWMVNTKVDHRELGWGGVDCIGFTQDRDCGRFLCCEDRNESSSAMQCREVFE